MQLIFITLILTVVPWTSESSPNQINYTLTNEYTKALQLSFLFFEAQRSGMLPKNNRIQWREDSGLNDGNSDWDLTGGYYNSGVNYVKSTFQTAFTTTMLVWGLLTWPTGYNQASQLDEVYRTIKWATEYFIKCSNLNTTQFVVQVGNITHENEIWDRPEVFYYDKAILIANSTHPATDIIAETVAALAAVSIAYREYFYLSEYSQMCLSYAKHLYDNFVMRNPGSHCKVLDCDNVDVSHDYGDEIIWASLWLYRATNRSNYLYDAKEAYDKYKSILEKQPFISYDNKGVAVEMLFAEMIHETRHMNRVEFFCDSLLTNHYTFTKKGLLYISRKHTLSFAANTAFICLVAATSKDYENTFRYYTFAKKQIHYMLGIDTGRSYVVGYGKNPPTQPCHKASSCLTFPSPCGWEQAKVDKPNPQILYGALISGPDADDYFRDHRLNNDSICEFYTEVNIEYNAGFTGALAGLLELELTKSHLFI